MTKHTNHIPDQQRNCSHRYYQMEGESEAPFTWEYLEAMPEEWKVKITKTTG